MRMLVKKKRWSMEFTSVSWMERMSFPSFAAGEWVLPQRGMDALPCGEQKHGPTGGYYGQCRERSGRAFRIQNGRMIRRVKNGIQRVRT